jgi:hypothetical protein
MSLRLGALSLIDWKRFRQEFQVVRQEAHATENVHASLVLALNEVLCDEIAGQPELSIARLEAQRELLPRRGFTIFHMLHLTAVMRAACATGKHAWGLEYAAANWDSFLRSPVRRVAALGSFAHATRARLLLNEHIRSRATPLPLRELMKDVKVGAKLPSRLDLRLRARIAYLEEDRGRALALFTEAAELCASRGWGPEAACDRYAIGRLTGGEQGEQMAQAALDMLTHTFGCHDALRHMQSYYPEFAVSL